MNEILLQNYGMVHTHITTTHIQLDIITQQVIELKQ
jgi:hypothetical protein